jgi:hypothetical protein
MERLDHKLDCKACGTIYLDIPDDVRNVTPSTAAHAAGSLVIGVSLIAISTDRVAKDGIFEMRDGQILRKS